MARSRQKKSRLQRKKEKESFQQAVKYLVLTLLLLWLMVKAGLPGLVRLAGFLGDVRSSGEPIERQDELAPAPPRIDPLPEATSEIELDISGYAESGSTVQLYARGISVQETVVDSEGQFMFKGVHLREGENDFYAMARDNQGNSSDESSTWTVMVDKTAPELEISSPGDGDEFFDTDSPITVEGKTENGVDLTINGRFVLVGANGGFAAKISLNEGDNQIEVVVKDKAENETRKTVTVKYSP